MIKNVLIAILFLLNIVFVGSYIKSQNNYGNKITKVVNNVINEKYWIELNYNWNIIRNLQVEEYVKSKRESLFLKQIIGNKPKLVFIFSQASCDACIYEEVEHIKELEKKIGAENIIILSAFNNSRDLFLFRETNKLKTRVFNVKVGELNLEFKKIRNPLYFVIDTALDVNLAFITYKELPRVRNKYFDIIEQKFSIRE